MAELETDRLLTARALELAARGTGLVSPGPLVGCVIVSAEGEIVGEGTYTLDDVVHAEVIALKAAGDRARGGTAYVSLEPHDHFNRTPPCTDALIDAGIRRVVCPIEDPNPKVSGRGFEHLRKAGIKVATGLLAAEATRLNEKFICWHQKRRPFVHLKLAISLDGRISVDSSVSTELSGETARNRVQDLRHEHDAILIGGNTAAVDDPSLTDRSGKPRRRPLVRVVLDNRLQIGLESKLATKIGEAPTIVFTTSQDRKKKEKLRASGVEVVELELGGRNLPAVLDELKLRDIQSVLVEGGSEIAGAFADARLFDKLTFLVAPIIIGGRSAPTAVGGAGADTLSGAIRICDMSVTRLGDDIELTGYPTG